MIPDPTYPVTRFFQSVSGFEQHSKNTGFHAFRGKDVKMKAGLRVTSRNGSLGGFTCGSPRTIRSGIRQSPGQILRRANEAVFWATANYLPSKQPASMKSRGPTLVWLHEASYAPKPLVLRHDLVAVAAWALRPARARDPHGSTAGPGKSRRAFAKNAQPQKEAALHHSPGGPQGRGPQTAGRARQDRRRWASVSCGLFRAC
jgi:hypothetical protein